jgi:hypothetical protein
MLIGGLCVPYIREKRHHKFRFLPLRTNKILDFFLETTDIDMTGYEDCYPAPPAVRGQPATFDHPRKVEHRGRRCKTCCAQIEGREGNIKLVKKVAASHTQCQKCAERVCKEHYKVVCIPCSSSLQEINEPNHDKPNSLDSDMEQE